MTKQLVKITDKIYYHIYSGKDVTVGEILEYGKQKNGMWKRVYEGEYKIKGTGSKEFVKAFDKRKLFRFIPAKAIKPIKYVLNDYDFTLRELALEEVRAEKFPSYPSRFTCLYVTEKEEEAIAWAPRLTWQRENCQLVKLKLTGKLFTGDSKFNAKDNDSLMKYREIADGYWQGKLSKNPQMELLFEGKAEVMEVIKKLN